MGHPNKKSEKEEETSSITSELSVDSALMAELDHMLCQPSEESSDQSGGGRRVRGTHEKSETEQTEGSCQENERIEKGGGNGDGKIIPPFVPFSFVCPKTRC